MSGGAPDPWLVIVGSLAIGILPLLVIMTTSFTKVSIVLALLRNALGVQQAPSNLALAGVSLAVTLLVMSPVMTNISEHLDVEAIMAGSSVPTMMDIKDAVKPPIVAFMSRHVDPGEHASLNKLVEEMHKDDNDMPSDLSVLIPAFVISEIGSAFKIGMLLAIGFAVIDLIIANLLMAMGMTMFPPSTLAIPIKLLVFVTSMGFSRLIHGLIASYPP